VKLYFPQLQQRKISNPKMLFLRLFLVACTATLTFGFLTPNNVLPLAVKSCSPSNQLNMHFEEATAETVLPTGALNRERYIACNRFKCRPNAFAKFEKRWADRTSRLAELEGFRWFSLLKRVEEFGADYSEEGGFGNYMSMTVWDNKDAFDEWRTGEAFKEAHGGGGITDFMKLLGTALFILDGAPKPAFYDGILPEVADEVGQVGSVKNGWRSDIVADGVNELNAEVFVAMNRFSIEPEMAIPFEQRWANRESKLKEMPGFRFFSMMRRDATQADDGYNYISLSIWEDKAAFENWRSSQNFAQAHGQGKKPESGEGKPSGPPAGPPKLFKVPPKTAFYEGKLVLTSEIGP